MVMVLVMVLTTMAAEAINKCPTKWEQHSPHPFLHIIKHTHTPDAKTTSRGLGEDGDRIREGGKSEKLSTLFSWPGGWDLRRVMGTTPCACVYVDIQTKIGSGLVLTSKRP